MYVGCMYREYQDTSSIRNGILSTSPLVTSEDIVLPRNRYHKTEKNWELFNSSKLNCKKDIPERTYDAHCDFLNPSRGLFCTCYSLDKRKEKARVGTSKDSEIVIRIYIIRQISGNIYHIFTRH